MNITERQEKILNKVIQEYINSVQPVSSQLLERKGSFRISPATLRIEMQQLTDEGYLFQPHTSAGRMPTDKGYRFFVDNLLKEEALGFEEDKFFDEIEKIEKEMKNSLQFAQALTKRIAELTSNLAMSYLPEEKIVLKEGWVRILKEPEFEDANCLLKFAETVDDCEKNIEKFFKNSLGFEIYIGKENPLLKVENFTIIFSRCHFPNEEGIVAILGPKRMAYQKNIGLINSIVKSLEKF